MAFIIALPKQAAPPPAKHLWIAKSTAVSFASTGGGMRDEFYVRASNGWRRILILAPGEPRGFAPVRFYRVRAIAPSPSWVVSLEGEQDGVRVLKTFRPTENMDAIQVTVTVGDAKTTRARSIVQSYRFTTSDKPVRTGGGTVLGIPSNSTASYSSADRWGLPAIGAYARNRFATLLWDVSDSSAPPALSRLLGRRSPGDADGTVLSVGLAIFSRQKGGQDMLVPEASRAYRGPYSMRFHVEASAQKDLPSAIQALSKAAYDAYIAPTLGDVPPQAQPFRFYAQSIYPPIGEAAEQEKEGGDGWFELKRGQEELGGFASQVPQSTKVVPFGAYANQLGSAFGLYQWGLLLGLEPWRERAEKMLRLSLDAPLQLTNASTAFDPSSRKWAPEQFSNGDPLQRLCETGYWLVRWSEVAPAPDRARIRAKLAGIVSQLLGAGSRGTKISGSGWPGNVWRTRFLAAFASTPSAGTQQERSLAKLAAVGLGRSLWTPTFSGPTDSMQMVTAVEALALLYRLQPGERFRNALESAVDLLALRQAHWNAPVRFGIQTFGGFAAEESKPSFLSYRSARIGRALVEAGDILKRRDIAIRGVIALRAGTVLLNDSLNRFMGLFREDSSVPLGKIGAYANGGIPYLGFDKGEGAAIGAIADVLSKFGQANEDLWLGIDGVTYDPVAGRWVSPMSLHQVPWSKPQEISVRKGKTGRRIVAQPQPGIRSLTIELRNGKLFAVAVPGGTSALRGQASGKFTLGDGSVRTAVLGPTGFELEVTISDLERGPISFEGSIGAFKLRAKPSVLYTDASVLGAPRLGARWWIGGDLADPFGVPGVDTSRNGKSGRSSSLIGTILSPAFVVTGTTLTFDLGGSGNAKVELIAELDWMPILSARPNGALRSVVWNLALFRGQTMRMRIVDKATGPGGYISLSNWSWISGGLFR